MKRKVLRAFFDVAKRCMQACITSTSSTDHSLLLAGWTTS
jgi:hypothetical protein